MDIFISHSSKDNKYGEIIVQLLIDIGVNRNEIVYTSKSGFGIPKGQNIFQWLKSKLTESPFVIYILSENYYSSIPCLNEMGAAWVIENEHLAFITPEFNISDKKFRDGAIDPREMVVFIDKEEDILEFIEIISKKKNLNNSLLHINQVVKKYKSSLEEANSNMNIEDDEKNLTSVSSSTYELFENDIISSQLIEEEILLIRYMTDIGTSTLGDRWMADGEIENIKAWESENTLNNKLSSNYQKALNRFITREYLDVNSTTSYGNPREYILKKDISKGILTLSKVVKEITDKALKENQISIEDIF